MRLKQIGFVLLGLPLACQLALGTVLIVDLTQLDAAAKREANAKSVITGCETIRGALAKYTMLLGAARFESSEDSAARLHNLQQLIEQQLGELKIQVAGDVKSEEDVRIYHDALKRLVEYFADVNVQFAGGQVGKHLARFIDEGEYLEELTAAYNATLRCESDLLGRYAPVENEFQPAAIRDRENALRLVIAGVILNAVLVIALAIFFGKVILARLNQLMTNISKFSKGETSLEPLVGGNDEFSELDLEFRLMAQAREQAEQFRRSLYAMVSHDLRSPLTSASLTLSTVLEKERDTLTAPTLKKLERLNHETSRLVKLANSFLDLEQAESGTLELHQRETNPSDLIESAINAVKGLADAKRVQIIIRSDEEKLICDGDRIVQVLVNLLSNSIKYAPRDSAIELTYTATETAARFEIKDKGPGISEADRAKLFTRFAQLADPERRENTGSGLGLYICKLLVEAHTGEIGMVSQPDGGSCFWFQLPLSTQ
ncbi:MAG TPA: HAMP domain-containing sensor histidine kinase [Trichormus sp.]